MPKGTGQCCCECSSSHGPWLLQTASGDAHSKLSDDLLRNLTALGRAPPSTRLLPATRGAGFGVLSAAFCTVALLADIWVCRTDLERVT